MTRRATGAAVAVVVAVAALTGCSSDHHDASADTIAAATSAVAGDSADAGFTRDMMVHHAQAVAMAEAIRSRTEDADLALFAADIALTQQAQIGRFAGWLEQWGLPNASLDPPMAWAADGHGGHDMDGMDGSGAMPGMATPEQVTALGTVPVDQAEIDFLTLMIAHHEGGVAMAEAVLPLEPRPEVARMAQLIIDAQVSEIAAMREMLAERGR